MAACGPLRPGGAARERTCGAAGVFSHSNPRGIGNNRAIRAALPERITHVRPRDTEPGDSKKPLRGGGAALTSN
jgi:hypothetical protein